jgi:hypothetical protein
MKGSKMATNNCAAAQQTDPSKLFCEPGHLRLPNNRPPIEAAESPTPTDRTPASKVNGCCEERGRCVEDIAEIQRGIEHPTRRYMLVRVSGPLRSFSSRKGEKEELRSLPIGQTSRTRND